MGIDGPQTFVISVCSRQRSERQRGELGRAPFCLVSDASACKTFAFSMLTKPAPSLYCIVASGAPTAVVFQRGPSKRWQIYKWDLSTGDLESGAVFRGTLYPRRSDLSPDGKILYYFALQGGKREFLGQSGVKTYSAVSKPPWLFALAAWPEDGTWTRGYRFVEQGEESGDIGPARTGDAGPLQTRFRLRLRRNMPHQYAVERRRGWAEDETCPLRGANDMWDERRSVVLTKPRPQPRRTTPTARLILSDKGLQKAGIEGRRPSFRLEQAKRTTELNCAEWADWDQFGRLLVATRDARLQIRDVDSPTLTIVREHVIEASPNRRPAPDWARTW